ncbi:MAG: hypothetical protein KAS93_04660 [Gammaproteobacteria bacterium]|nr:hypothetical protein [Gammaproteobacteria bacterium]
MSNQAKIPHSFHIPVMGTGFTIDTPLKVAKYGISSAISLVDDVLIEQIRKFHCEKSNEPYNTIKDQDDDARARRITAYLNLLDRLINKQIKELQASPFEKGNEITRYYEMLPNNPIKKLYLDMLATNNLEEKTALQNTLRKAAVPGSIDVNIMTKLDRDNYRDGIKQPLEHSDALAALRGYANSTLNSGIVFSAGFNPRLYGYISQFNDFLPDDKGNLKKRIILKVSDYRSAYIQGKYLAKHGIWVSEYRIESALNCGGHAFANDGYLMGPILQEFKEKRDELITTLHGFYNKALANRNKNCLKEPLKVSITAQGGIGTNDEHMFLLGKYNLDAVGWGTPFLLVPEGVNIDDEHLQKLAAATEKEVYLSDNSPLGIPFWNLSTSASEEERRHKIESGKPGSPCLKQFAQTNTEFTKLPICTASRIYQKLKLRHLPEEGWTTKQLQIIKDKILCKACICYDLAGSVTKKYMIDNNAKTAVCPGPNIVNFSKIATLDEMLSHIYGRISLITSSNRPHVFLKELMIHVDYLKKEATASLQGLATRSHDKLCEVKTNIANGIEYYQKLASKLLKEQQEIFIDTLQSIKDELEHIAI